MIASLVLTLAACKKEAETANGGDSASAGRTTAADMTPEQLGELAARISREPQKSEKVLQERGLDAASFEKAVREVSESPDAAKRYSESFRKEQGSGSDQPN